MEQAKGRKVSLEEFLLSRTKVNLT